MGVKSLHDAQLNWNGDKFVSYVNIEMQVR